MKMHESLERIYDAKDLLGTAFYERFFAACPEAKQYFEGVDMHRQAMVLTMALTLVEQFSRAPYRATEDYLLFLGARHRQRKIPRDLYPQWLEAMLATLQGFHDNDWSPTLADRWKNALEKAINKLFEAYESEAGE